MARSARFSGRWLETARRAFRSKRGRDSRADRAPRLHIRCDGERMGKDLGRPPASLADFQVNIQLWPAIFLITLAETLIATWEGRADRRSTTAKTIRWSIIAANWALGFEIVLLVDLYILVKEGPTIIIPIGAGAWIGKMWACERRRRKFRKNAGRLRKKKASDKVDPTPVRGCCAEHAAGSSQQSAK